ncbi:ABC transporter permease [Deinococcus metallilatus]|uniref:ABC transporter permease n=1 Tax=Deinococcus metallilatus TaxID=1211322 RepID=A0AAJ5JYV4_9DEIO|nr:ABC transporter permease [Deinococcus metallilatus]MBB5294953.1 peptide/nickel transport system permease protein [Deinococcus metallilatus]QBY09349.1 ABC transporter permease [Deinococcus metallilatus]RXJ09354.1 ABC transporter permease [Deinococcus metallilatus]TLK28876.1 ABC transporter permease [Deinococcus metallilatus]GMA16884.1 diguanylate cyclase [Deinococcus metallilatus]
MAESAAGRGTPSAWRIPLNRWPPALRLGGALVGLVVLMALLSLVWLPADPNAQDLLGRLQPPNAAHLLGTDQYGRDLLARILVGARASLLVGAVAVGIGLGAGLALGLLAGFFGGRTDRIIMLLLEALYSLPALLLAMLLVTAWGPGLVSAMTAVGIAAIPAFTRVARASVLQVRAMPYVEAATALGARPRRVMLRHILPNILGPLIVQASLTMGAAVLIEASLSYLGLGIQPPTASWGRMLRESQSFMVLSPYATVFPGLAVAAVVLGFNLLGDGLRDLLGKRSG